jgi:hypothetical protein
LLAIAVIGLAGTATLGAFATSISASTTQSGLTSIELAAQNYANISNFDIVLQPYPLFNDSWCDTSAGAGGATSPYTPPLTGGITYSQGSYVFTQTVSYWNGTEWTDSGPCVNTTDVPDAQLVTVTATLPPQTAGGRTSAQQTATDSFVVTEPPSDVTENGDGGFGPPNTGDFCTGYFCSYGQSGFYGGLYGGFHGGKFPYGSGGFGNHGGGGHGGFGGFGGF